MVSGTILTRTLKVVAQLYFKANSYENINTKGVSYFICLREPLTKLRSFTSFLRMIRIWRI